MSQPTLVVAVDFATHANEICDAAVELGRDLGARILLLHVLQLGPIQPEVEIQVSERRGRARELLEEDARRRLAPLIQRVAGSGLTVELCLRSGEAEAQVRACAEDAGARYLVIGSDLTSGLRRLVGPGFTERILRASPCPVLVVRTGAQRPTPGPGPVRGQVEAEADG